MKPKFKYIKLFIPLFVIILIIASALLWLKSNEFDETYLNENNILSHINELSSKKYSGRLAGTEGNELALDYIEDLFSEWGIEPAGENGTYYQNFSAIIPQIDTNPEFKIFSDSGDTLKELTMYKDYKVTPALNGGSVDFYGDLIIVGSNLFRIDPELIKGKIVVVEANGISLDSVLYVTQNGGKGLLCGYERLSRGAKYDFVAEKSLDVWGKTGQSVAVGYLSNSIYKYMLSFIEENNIEGSKYYEGIIPNVKIKADISFPVIETANILGKIEGRVKNGKTLIISANIDGSGTGVNGNYFPGAISNVSGVATLLETARVISQQKNLPYETIIFIGFNAQQQLYSGSDFYLKNPLYPLEQSKIIHLINIGDTSREGTRLYSDNIYSSILKNKIKNYADDMNLFVLGAGISESAVNSFADKKIAAVTLSDASYWLDTYELDTYEDTIDNVNSDALKNSALVLLSYIKRDIYKDVAVDYLTYVDKLILFIFLLGLIFNYVVIRLYKTNPNARLGKSTAESLYFNSAVTFLRKAYFVIAPLILSVFMLSFLANINPESNIKAINGETVTNVSLYLTTKNSILYLKSLFSFSPDSISESAGLLKVISKSSLMTIKLMSAALILSTLLGIVRGMYEGYRSHRGRFKSLLTLVIFSIPDVLIVLLGMVFYIYISQNYPNVKDVIKLDEFVLPLITLSILPTIYISRITFITIEDETKKEYVKSAKAKGFSRLRIFAGELFPAVIFKITDSLPAIMTMILSNMIVVEYLFNYTGVVYYLLYFFKKQDINGFIALSLVLGTIFIVLTWGIKFIARMINPLKKEEKNEKA